MNDYIGFVYVWTNKLNGKKYVGLHMGKVDDGYIGSGKLFKSAVEKYGIENFDRQILYFEYETEETLYQKEFDIINEFNAVKDRTFYNATNYDPKYVKFQNGERTRVHTNETKELLRQARTDTTASEQTRQKMSESQKNREFTEEHKKKLSDSQKGDKNHQSGKKWYNNGIIDKTFYPDTQPDGWVLGRIRGVFKGKSNPFYGKTHSDETKKKISESRKRKLYEIN